MVVKSPHPHVSVPDVPLAEFVLEHAGDRPDKPALIDGPSGRTLTYSGLAGGVRAVAGGLAARGFGKGDVFAIYSPNLPEYALAFHAIAAVGGINTTVNPLYTAAELATQLKDCRARFLLTIPQFLDKATEAAGDSGVQEVFVLGDAPGATPFSSLLTTGTEPPTPATDVHEDLVTLPYSSGTTGLPKGVMLTHHNLVANICQSITPIGVAEDDVIIGILPFFHIYGMTVIMNLALRNGATIVTMPRFDLEEFLRLMQDHRVTKAFLVPPIILALAKHPVVDKYDLSALDYIMSGAAPLGPDLAAACSDRLGCRVIQGYGLTETSPVTHVIPETGGVDKPGSIGPLLPNTEARIVDPAAGTDAGRGEDGELWMRGPQVMKGYLHDPESTSGTIDDEGWLHSGDIGHADDDGYFYIVDRLKELIKYKGMQVAPAELEAVLLSHEAVTDAAVVGVPDEDAGEVPKAFVVLAEDVNTDGIVEFVAARVAPHKRIRQIEVVDEIPKSPSGKILRRKLRERVPS